MIRCNRIQASKRYTPHVVLASKLLGDCDPGTLIGTNKVFSITQYIIEPNPDLTANVAKTAARS